MEILAEGILERLAEDHPHLPVKELSESRVARPSDRASWHLQLNWTGRWQVEAVQGEHYVGQLSVDERQPASVATGC